MSRLLFRAFKTFWKTKNSINIVFIEHSDQDIYEIIAYDPVLCQHAPRLHIDACTIRMIMNNDANQSSKNKVLIVDGAIAIFLFNHLVLVEYLPTTKIIKIDIQPVLNSEKTFKDYPFIVNRPSNLQFYPSPFITKHSSNDYDIEDSNVYEFGCVRHLQLSLRDKWRLPLIIVRVSKSLPLRESDAKIWACFVHNKTQAELVKSIALALAAGIPSKGVESAVHNALLPPDCPFPVKSSGNSNIPYVSSTAKTTPCVSRRNSGDSTTISVQLNSISEKSEIGMKKQKEKKKRIHSFNHFWPLSTTSTTASRSTASSIVPTDQIEENDDSEIALGRTIGNVGNTKLNKFSMLNSSFVSSKAPRRRSYSKMLINWANRVLYREHRIVPTTTTTVVL